MCHFRLQYLYRCGTTYAVPSIENCEFKMVCSSCEDSGHLSVAVAQFTVAEEPERNLEIIDGFARDAAIDGFARDTAAGDREADLITAELSRECLDSARRTLPVLQDRRFADPQLCD
nr:hypothetical protein [Bifidobacterium longum]